MIYFVWLLVCVLILSNLLTGDSRRIKPIAYAKFSTKPVPAFASLCEEDNYEGEIYCFCGASFLTTRLLLTAAHCIDEGEFVNLRIRWGSVHQDVVKREQKVSGKYIHISPPGFGGVPTDFGMLVLQEAVKLDNETRLIYYHTEMPRSGTKIISYGHGMHESGEHSNILKELEMIILTDSACSQAWRTLYRNKLRIPCPPCQDLPTEAYFCAVSAEGGLAEGDSGGPAFVVGEDFRQVGLLSKATFPNKVTYYWQYYYWQFFVNIHYPPIMEFIELLKTYSVLDRTYKSKVQNDITKDRDAPPKKNENRTK